MPTAQNMSETVEQTCRRTSVLSLGIQEDERDVMSVFILQGALKFPLQTSRTCRGDWFDTILNWNPCPETYRFHATAIWKQALSERTSRVSTSNSFAIHPPAELHDEGCLGRIMWCQLTFILPLAAGLSLIHVSFSVRATWLSTLLLIHQHDLYVWRSSR